MVRQHEKLFIAGRASLGDALPWLRLSLNPESYETSRRPLRASLTFTKVAGIGQLREEGITEEQGHGGDDCHHDSNDSDNISETIRF